MTASRCALRSQAPRSAGSSSVGMYVLGIPGVRDATPEELALAIGPVIQHYLTGPIGTHNSNVSSLTREY